MAGARTRILLEDDGAVWEVRVGGPAGFGHDTVRFTGPGGQVRIGAIPERTWDQLTEEALDRAFLRSQLLPGRAPIPPKNPRG